MPILKPIIVGASASFAASYVLHDFDGQPWDSLSIFGISAFGITLFWSWVIFAVFTLIALVLQKVTRS